jgi:hypothetical protein
MRKAKGGQPPKTNWAYGYKIMPPQPEERLQAIKTLLELEHAEAKRGARTWAGRVVLEEQVTHILVVSDTPSQNRDVNRRLEATLKSLKLGFTLTTPLAVVGDDVPSTEPARS